jgi:hypothetical protein
MVWGNLTSSKMEVFILHHIPWYLALAISIPQAILMIYIGFSLCNIKVDLSRCIVCSIIIAIIAYFIRRLPILLAANTLILTVILVILTSLAFRIHLGKTLIALLLGVMISGVIEGSVLQGFLFITGHTAEELSVNAGLNMIAYMPVFIITLSVLGLIKHFDFVAFDLGKRELNA